MRCEGCAPAKGDPVEPPHIRGRDHVDREQKQIDADKDDRMQGEAARSLVLKERMPARTRFQQQHDIVGGNTNAPARQYPERPELARVAQEIERDQRDDDGRVNAEMDEEAT